MKKIMSCITIIITFLILVTVAFASGEAEGGHESAKWFDLVKKSFNFFVLIGLLYWFLASKIKEFFHRSSRGN